MKKNTVKKTRKMQFNKSGKNIYQSPKKLLVKNIIDDPKHLAQKVDKAKKDLFKWIREYWQIVLYSLIALSFIVFIIFMIVNQRMQELDVGIKYIIYPIYMLMAVIFGNSAKFLHEKRQIIVHRREIDSRWATFNEIKKHFSFVNIKENEVEGAGIPVFSDGENSYVDNSESHTLIIGSTGSGKTRRIILPQISFLLHNNESVIVTDPKGELFEQTSGAFKKHGYKIITLNFRDPKKSDCWNPLSVPYQYFQNGQIDKAMEMINDIALNILYDNANDKDPFWEKSAVDYFIGLALGLCEDASPEQITLNNISYMSTNGQESFLSSNYIKEYFLLKNKYSNAYTCASGTVEAPNDTRASIISVFQQKLRIFTSQENLSQMLSYSNFAMEDIGLSKTIVYMIIQDEKSTYHPLAVAFIKQCYEVLIDCATRNGGKLPVRTNFILDEFGNLPPIIDMTSIVSAARSRNIRLTMAIQSNKQLDSVYGESDAEVIKNNCNNLVFLYGRDLRTLKDISELCGNKEEQIDFNLFEQKPLITTSQLQHLTLGEAIFITKENYPYKSKLPDFNDYSFSRYPSCKYSTRPDVDLSHFDIKEYVENAKRRKILDKIEIKQSKSTSNYDTVRSDSEHFRRNNMQDNAIETNTFLENKFTACDYTAAPIKYDQSNHTQSINDETNEERQLMLCDHFFTKAFEAYMAKDFETAEKYFTKIYYLDNMADLVKNNLAYMKRRGETKSFSVPIVELLNETPEKNDAFELINLSLCYICGIEVPKDCTHAFRLIRKIEKRIADAEKWWSDVKNCGEAEMQLVLFLLKASGKTGRESKEELEVRFKQVLTLGYDLPSDTVNLLMCGD